MLVSILTGIIALIAATATADYEKKEDKNAPKFVRLKIGHRVHLDFKEEVTAQMNKRYYIGDTEFSFEATEFYPHFAIVDSTREVISLSDEPKNPAIKIRVYEKDEPVDETWAFYAFRVPHFSRTSLVSFQVMAFEYRGTVYDQNESTGDDSEGGSTAEGGEESDSEL
jgi:hypothetical protein